MLGGGAVAAGLCDPELSAAPTAFVVHSGEHRVSRVILADSASDTVALGKMS
jgi:hypothetical protein